MYIYKIIYKTYNYHGTLHRIIPTIYILSIELSLHSCLHQLASSEFRKCCLSITYNVTINNYCGFDGTQSWQVLLICLNCAYQYIMSCVLLLHIMCVFNNAISLVFGGNRNLIIHCHTIFHSRSPCRFKISSKTDEF